MSKKDKKKRLRRPSVPSLSSAPQTESALPGQRRLSGGQREFQPDYSHVKKDLRRIAVLAGAFITILIVLSIFLR